jgi:hypothetical protein
MSRRPARFSVSGGVTGTVSDTLSGGVQHGRLSGIFGDCEGLCEPFEQTDAQLRPRRRRFGTAANDAASRPSTSTSAPGCSKR